jgi:hypothetical protein
LEFHQDDVIEAEEYILQEKRRQQDLLAFRAQYGYDI